MAELSKAYQPSQVEEKWYQRWQDANCFRGDENSHSEAYSIVIPPPNVTGILHLGHILNNTIQDILARRARMQGKTVLWLPGTDHAGIATQTRVERQIRQEEGKTRHDLGREEFLKRVWTWKEKHGGIIISQLKRLGCSCDWSRERFTMDAEYSRWVSKVFVDLFAEGLIYRGKRMVNWCPKSLTALSDEEVIMKPQKGKLYYMRYPVVGQEGRFVEIATTRPETLMGDTAVAVNPKDPRYADLIGQKVRRPFPEAEIPIIADDYIDVEFGTGVLKVTPAHDKNDFLIGQRHNLEIRDVFNPDATLNELAGPEFAGMDRFEAREKAAAKLESMGLLVKTEPYENNVGFSERADVPIEPRLSMQWFLKYPCVKEATEAVADDSIAFRPERWKKTYLHWMENIQDWCISRQLWWGHQIPVWYRKDRAAELQGAESLDASNLGADLHVGVEPPADESGWVRDADVLDTWFSSWLWPFATMTPSEGAATLTVQKFYPTSDLVTGPDILFFWVARMIMAGYRFEKELPFRNVFYTSIIRDRFGRKLSKMLGNSPDPLDIIANLGADAMRFSLLKAAPIGTDVRFFEDRTGFKGGEGPAAEKQFDSLPTDKDSSYPQVEEGRNFANKLWNACRYRQMQGAAEVAPAPLAIYDLDILAKLDRLEKDLDRAYGDYKFNEIAQLLYDFVWSQFCDWYLESLKGALGKDADPARKATALNTMDKVLRRVLMHLHPYMPHLTEELWEQLGFAEDGKLLMTTQLPKDSVIAGLDMAAAQSQAAAIYQAVGRARNLKAEYNLAANRNVKFIIVPSAEWVGNETAAFKTMAGAAEALIDPAYQSPRGEPTALTDIGQIFMPLAGLIDIEAEKSRLSKELAKVKDEITRGAAKLGNAQFVQNAPEAVVAEARERQAAWEERQRQLEAMIASLG